MMSERDFWDLLDVMRGEVDHDAVDRLRDALTALSRKAVIAFQHRLADRLYVRAGRGSQRQPGRCTWATCSPLRPTFAPGEDRNAVTRKLGAFKTTGASPNIPTIPQTGPKADATRCTMLLMALARLTR